MGFKNLGFSRPHDATSLVLQSVKKNPKNLKTAYFFGKYMSSRSRKI